MQIENIQALPKLCSWYCHRNTFISAAACKGRELMTYKNSGEAFYPTKLAFQQNDPFLAQSCFGQTLLSIKSANVQLLCCDLFCSVLEQPSPEPVSKSWFSSLHKTLNKTKLGWAGSWASVPYWPMNRRQRQNRERLSKALWTVGSGVAKAMIYSQTEEGGVNKDRRPEPRFLKSKRATRSEVTTNW